MILYFSGTGNSQYVARRMGKIIDDKVIDLFEKIKNKDLSKIRSERPWVIVAPTYAWRIPRIVQKWLEGTDLTGNSDIYFVLTCGDSIGNAGKYLQKLCAAKKMNYCGCMGITMPENYLALFSTPTAKAAAQIIENAQTPIEQAARFLKNGEAFPKSNSPFGDKLKSSIINQIFYPMFVHANKFYTTDSCVSCGICMKVCPLENIRLEAGKPVWGDECTHCMACICRCPKEAIEYGKHSKGLPRYICSKEA